MRNDYFAELVHQFEQQCFQHFMSTGAHEVKKREGVYNTFTGVRDFIGHMRACVEQKQKLTTPSPVDALIEDD